MDLRETQASHENPDPRTPATGLLRQVESREEEAVCFLRPRAADDSV
jgi:hypothetical protein